MSSRANQTKGVSAARWAARVTYTDGNEQDFVFADREQARDAVSLILNAESGSVVKLSEHVFVQRDQVSSAEVTHRGD